MYRSTHAARAAAYRQSLLDAIKLWLALGSLLLLTGLLPAHSALLGWSLPFWLVAAPLLLLSILAPRLPGQWLRWCGPRRRPPHATIWS